MSNGYIYADDSDPQVAYTGSWTQITRTGPYANSLHSTTQSGASATVHFTGPSFANSTLILYLPLLIHFRTDPHTAYIGNLGRVLGSVPACDSSIHQESVIVAISLDDVSVGQVTLPCGATNRNSVVFYDSGTLSGGNQLHKLSAVNQLGNCLPFQFDAFAWEVDSGAPSTTAVAAPPYSVSLMTSGSRIIVIQGSSGPISASMRGPSTVPIAPVTSSASPAADVVASSFGEFVSILLSEI